MKAPVDPYLKQCLFFTANSLARTVAKMAEEDFAALGYSPSHAFLMMIVIEKKSVSQKILAKELNLDQSTVSRLVDTLVGRGYLEKKVSGKTAEVKATGQGTGELTKIQVCWTRLYERYCQILGTERAENLTAMAFQSHVELESALAER